MSRQYERFEPRSGGELILAVPARGDVPPIRLPGEWFDLDDDDPTESRWMSVVRGVLAAALDAEDGLSIRDGRGVVGREVFVAELQRQDVAETPDQADALVEYFDENGALSIENDEEVVLLFDLDAGPDSVSGDVSAYRALSWAAAFDVLASRVAVMIEALERGRELSADRPAPREAFDGAIETLERLASTYEERADEIRMAVFKYQVFPQEGVEIVDIFSSIVCTLSDASSLETDHTAEELGDVADEILEDGTIDDEHGRGG